LKNFLGLCAYYQKFTDGFTDITKPLVQLTGKKQTFQLYPVAEIAFWSLKKLLCMAPIHEHTRLGDQTQETWGWRCAVTSAGEPGAGSNLLQ
jgi:hypothetical protein